MPRKKVDVKKRILKALDGKAMNWVALLRETDVSKGALSKHLNDLIDRKIVLTTTKDSRPPRTIYSLAKTQFIKLTLFVTQGMKKEQIINFFKNILTVEVVDTLIESYNKIFNLISLFGLTNPKSLRLPIADIFSMKGTDLEKLDEISKEHQSLGRTTIPQILNINYDFGTDIEELKIWESRMFTHIAIHFVLTIYHIEKLCLNVFPEESQTKMKESGDLKNTIVLDVIQKKGVWEAFDKFFNWWYEEMSQKIPSSELLGYLALRFYTDTYVPNLKVSPSL